MGHLGAPEIGFLSRSPMVTGQQSGSSGRRRRLGRLTAQVICVLFGLVGALPLLAGLIIRTEPVRAWAQVQTLGLLKSELGLEARFRAAVSLWPLKVRIEDLVVPSKLGGEPALRVPRIDVLPRLFSLLAGHTDVGEVEIERPQVKLVLEHGRISNVAYRLPKTDAKMRDRGERPPFSVLAVTAARVDLSVDGYRVQTDAVDLDVLAQRGPTFEIYARSAQASITHHEVHHFRGDTESVDAHDEDRICELDVRAHVDKSGALLRRLSLLGRADLDPRPGTRPNCGLLDSEDNLEQVALRASQTSVNWSGHSPKVTGQLLVRVPVALANRFLRFLPLGGWIGLNADVSWDGSTRLPNVRGRVRGSGIALGRYRVAQKLDLELAVDKDVVRIPRADIGFGNGTTRLVDVQINPTDPNVPFRANSLETHGLDFPGLMRDLGVTNKTVVAWNLTDTTVSNLKGQLGLPELEGRLVATTRGFEVFDRAFDAPSRRRMIGVSEATVRGTLAVTPTSVQFKDTVASFGHSQLLTPLVSIGFSNELDIEIAKDSVIDLADVSPLINIPMAGRSRVNLRMAGDASDPLLTGTLAIDQFVFGGFPLGDIASAKVRFRPLKLDLTDVQAKKGKSVYTLSTARLDFDQAATLVASAHAESSYFDVRDFLSMWHLQDDPRYAELFGAGRVNADVHYVLGGAKDRCGDGWLDVTAELAMNRAELFGERYDSADASVNFTWSDQRAGFLGVSLDVPSVTLRKGSGALLGSFQVRPGAKLTGQLVGTAIPVGRLDGLGAYGSILDGEVSGEAEVGGTLDALSAKVHVAITPVRIGTSQFPGSELTVRLEPAPRSLDSVGTTRCGQPIPGPFDAAKYQADQSLGVFHVTGQLFGGQLKLRSLDISRQRHKHARGTIEAKGLDIGSIAEALPPGIRPEQSVRGRLNGVLTLEDLPLDSPSQARAALEIGQIDIEQGNLAATISPAAGPIVIAGRRMQVPLMQIDVAKGRGLRGTLDASGVVVNLGRQPTVNAAVALHPIDLARLKPLLPKAERLGGQLIGRLELSGQLAHPKMRGALSVEHGELSWSGVDLPLSDVALHLQVTDNEVRVQKGSARLGSGTLTLRGSAPLSGFDLGMVRLSLRARGVTVPPSSGIEGTLDANLETTIDPDASPIRPRITGDIDLDGLRYTRPVTMTADVAHLAQRGKRSEVKSYDPSDDLVEFDLVLKSKGPLRIKNGLVEAEMQFDRSGLELTGTNQQFGLRGTVRAVPGGRIQLRQNVFEIREGTITFNEANRIAPRVDVVAVTDYHRYSTQASAAASGAPETATGSGTNSATGGRWRITMHAHGDADQLRIDLTSDPALSQDDIFLLLTVGVTRAELDQSQSASVGSSVALEALGTLSGADRAVTETLPLIDDFRFGSAYSSRTGRTEPTVTIGKRLAERIRASITSGVAETREVRSNVEWRLNPQLSVEGSYDNVNDISSSQLGNLGADVRWRIEFQ